MFGVDFDAPNGLGAGFAALLLLSTGMPMKDAAGSVSLEPLSASIVPSRLPRKPRHLLLLLPYRLC
jgi:hypothetical protein